MGNSKSNTSRLRSRGRAPRHDVPATSARPFTDKPQRCAGPPCTARDTRPFRAGALLLLASTGCMVGPHYVRPEVALNAQSQWSAAADQRFATQTAVNQAWWRTFNDPTLDRLIE